MLSLRAEGGSVRILVGCEPSTGYRPLEIRTAAEAREKLGWLIRDDDPLFAPVDSVVVYKGLTPGPTVGVLQGYIARLLYRARHESRAPTSPAPRFTSAEILRVAGLEVPSPAGGEVTIRKVASRWETGKGS
jgi:hypothetical protein